jgi:hypothetical protein
MLLIGNAWNRPILKWHPPESFAAFPKSISFEGDVLTRAAGELRNGYCDERRVRGVRSRARTRNMRVSSTGWTRRTLTSSRAGSRATSSTARPPGSGPSRWLMQGISAQVPATEDPERGVKFLELAYDAR